MKENELKKQAMGIVNQLFDLAEVPVEKRQEINDKADEYVTEQLRLCGVGNCADLNPPHFKQKKMNEKAEKAKHLKNIGYSIREIMSIMNYKSPKSIQDLLKR